MSYGILSFGAYVPSLRLDRKAVFEAVGWATPNLRGLASGERSVANWDEDAITMAVEAGLDCLADTEFSVPHICMASTTFPFSDRSNSGLVADALNLQRSIATEDFGGSRRAGTSALSRALSNNESSLMIASDCREAQPGSVQEMNYGHGSACVLLGEGKPIAEFLSSSSEHEDLISAIGKLRRGINELNREGRQRLLTSFEEVDKHFQGLFVRLFGGGRAHLELVESDDPLEAGLEIMASPPGKRLQVLSLLSGGEQALTALSLLFAVFMTNPAPICVLDEVDAPLDDANVDRFCTMVDEMAHSLSTRFLVITHHRMTMARMDRLFGVTMGEQGVSQLVSVDLGQAIELRDIA